MTCGVYGGKTHERGVYPSGADRGAVKKEELWLCVAIADGEEGGWQCWRRKTSGWPWVDPVPGKGGVALGLSGCDALPGPHTAEDSPGLDDGAHLAVVRGGRGSSRLACCRSNTLVLEVFPQGPAPKHLETLWQEDPS